MFSTLTSARLLRRSTYATLIGLTLGFTVFVATSSGLVSIKGGRVGGDFPAFYSAGQIVRSGDGGVLYDFAVQRRSQREFFPGEEAAWMAFPYPPFVAAAYVPFTLTNFKTAYVLHTLLMVLCSVAALWQLRHHLSALAHHFPVAVGAALAFYPLFRANVGGQNTAVSLLCAAGAASALASRHEVVAGVWLGLWLFKPQLAAPVIALVAVAGYWRPLIGVAVVATIYFVIGAAVSGIAWPVTWLAALAVFAEVNPHMDGLNGLSFREVAAELKMPFVAWCAIAVVGVYVLYAARLLRGQPLALVGMAASAAVLLAPHGLFYDGGLAIIGLAVAAESAGAGALRYLLGAWLLGGAQHLRPFLPLPPLTALLTTVVVSIGARSVAKPASNDHSQTTDNR